MHTFAMFGPPDRTSIQFLMRNDSLLYFVENLFLGSSYQAQIPAPCKVYSFLCILSITMFVIMASLVDNNFNTITATSTFLFTVPSYHVELTNSVLNERCVVCV